MIKLSIIVPIYNVEKFLHKCLKSIQDQTFKDFEVLCIDDGSTDNSREITESFITTDSRFRLYSKANSGYGNTMNLGLSKCSGEYVGIIESDDFIESSMFEVLYNAAKESDLEVVKCDFSYYWSNPEKVVPSNSLKQKNVFDIIPSIWSSIYKRSFLEENNIKFLETPGASFQDTGFNFKVWNCAKKYKLIPQNLVFYRQDNVNSSIKSSAKIFHICEEFEEIERFLKRRNSNFIRRQALCYLWNYRRLGKTGRKEFSKVLTETSKSIFKDGNYFGYGFTLKQLFIFWTAAFIPPIFKLLVISADE